MVFYIFGKVDFRPPPPPSRRRQSRFCLEMKVVPFSPPSFKAGGFCLAKDQSIVEFIRGGFSLRFWLQDAFMVCSLSAELEPVKDKSWQNFYF